MRAAHRVVPTLTPSTAATIDEIGGEEPTLKNCQILVGQLLDGNTVARVAEIEGRIWAFYEGAA